MRFNSSGPIPLQSFVSPTSILKLIGRQFSRELSRRFATYGPEMWRHPSRSTGTDTDSFAYSAEGVASALISLPLKYMHTTVEMVHKEDVENVINLIYEVLLQVKPDHDYRYIK